MTLTENHQFTAIMVRLRHQVILGNHLHQAMATYTYFPVMMIQMIKIGELTGSLETMLQKTAHFIEAEIDHSIHRLNDLLEPLIMLILGALIGVVVIAMYLPVFNLGTTF